MIEVCFQILLVDAVAGVVALDVALDHAVAAGKAAVSNRTLDWRNLGKEATGIYVLRFRALKIGHGIPFGDSDYIVDRVGSAIM